MNLKPSLFKAGKNEKLKVKSFEATLHSSLLILNSKGSVLIWVIWAITILSIFTVSVNKQVTAELVFGRWLMDKTLTRGFAKAGIERALYELEQDKLQIFDGLNENWAANPEAFKQVPMGSGDYSVVCDPEQGYDMSVKDKFRYGVCDEAARLNLNTATEDMVRNLLTAVFPEMEDKIKTDIAQSLIDWRDPDDAKLSNGAEENEYASLKVPYQIRNGPLESVEEFLMVRGVTPEIYNGVRPYVTVYTDGKINFNTAPLKVLQALGLNPELAERVAEYRKGGDGQEGTEDDQIFMDAGSITASFSASEEFSSEDFAQTVNAISAGLVGIRSNVFRIYSIGRLIRGSRSVDELITCVARRDGKMLYWKEGRS
jgi:general secretion pathway protein K